jgi:hypothetical protein
VEKNVQRARLTADTLAQELLTTAGFPLQPPADIDALAEELGASVEKAALTDDGSMMPTTDGRAILWISTTQPPVRQRFTTAHELAHWALRSPRLRTPIAELAASRFTSEEVLCNTVAGALLMPQPWMRSVFAEIARSATPLGTVIALAREANVSLEAAAVRLRDVLGWRRSLLHWVWERPDWVFDGEAGLMPWEQGLVRPSAAAGATLTEVRSGGALVRRRLIPLMIGTLPEADYDAEVIAWMDHAAGLIEIPQNCGSPRVRRRSPRPLDARHGFHTRAA